MTNSDKKEYEWQNDMDWDEGLQWLQEYQFEFLIRENLCFRRKLSYLINLRQLSIQYTYALWYGFILNCWKNKIQISFGPPMLFINKQNNKLVITNENDYLCVTYTGNVFCIVNF